MGLGTEVGPSMFWVTQHDRMYLSQFRELEEEFEGVQDVWSTHFLTELSRVCSVHFGEAEFGSTEPTMRATVTTTGRCACTGPRATEVRTLGFHTWTLPRHTQAFYPRSRCTASGSEFWSRRMMPLADDFPHATLAWFFTGTPPPNRRLIMALWFDCALGVRHNWLRPFFLPAEVDAFFLGNQAMQTLVKFSNAFRTGSGSGSGSGSGCGSGSGMCVCGGRGGGVTK